MCNSGQNDYLPFFLRACLPNKVTITGYRVFRCDAIFEFGKKIPEIGCFVDTCAKPCASNQKDVDNYHSKTFVSNQKYVDNCHAKPCIPKQKDVDYCRVSTHTSCPFILANMTEEEVARFVVGNDSGMCKAARAGDDAVGHDSGMCKAVPLLVLRQFHRLHIV